MKSICMMITVEETIERAWVLRGAPRITEQQAAEKLEKWKYEIIYAAHSAAETFLDRILTDLDPVEQKP